MSVAKTSIGVVGFCILLLIAIAVFPTIGTFVLMLILGILHGFFTTVPALGFLTIWKVWLLVEGAAFVVSLVLWLIVLLFAVGVAALR